MNIKELRTFLTLCETLHYPKAAQRLSYAPSTLNKHVQSLEQELGVALFSKEGRHLEITPQGAAFRPHAQKLLEDYDSAMQSVLYAGQGADTLVVGGCEMTVSSGLVQLFSSFATRNAQVRLRIRNAANASVPDMVRGRDADVGIYYNIGAQRLSGLQYQPLFQEPIRLMATADNPLTQGGPWRYEDLAGLGFVLPHDDCPAVISILRCLKEREVCLGPVQYLGAVSLVMEKIRKGHRAVALQHSATGWFAAQYGLRVIPLAEEDIWMQAQVVYRSYDALSPIGQSLVRYCRQYAHQQIQRDPSHFLPYFCDAL